jgi:hypothetical protein
MTKEEMKAVCFKYYCKSADLQHLFISAEFAAEL